MCLVFSFFNLRGTLECGVDSLKEERDIYINLFLTQETLSLRCSGYMCPSRKPNQNNKNKPHQFLLQTLAASAPFGPRLVDLL